MWGKKIKRVVMLILVWSIVLLICVKTYGMLVTAEEKKEDQKYEEIINVKDYGACGDGVTDDAAVIETIINENTGKKIYFPAGEYILNAPVIIGSNTTLLGDGKDSIIKAAPGKPSGSAMLYINNTAKNVYIENLCISGNSSVNNDSSYNDQDGIHMLDMWNVQDVTIKSCYFIDNVYTAIRIFGGEKIKVLDSYFSNVDCGIITLGEYEVSDLKIDNCHFDGHKMSEAITLYGENKYENIIITNNVIKNKEKGMGIYVGRAALNSNIAIRDNLISNCAVGICARNIVDGYITNNTVLSTTDGKGIELTNCEQMIVVDNSIDATHLDSLLIKDCESSYFQNNQITITCNAKNKDVAGIKLLGNNDHVYIYGNEVRREEGSLNIFSIIADTNGSVFIFGNDLSSLPVFLYPNTSGVYFANNGNKY